MSQIWEDGPEDQTERFVLLALSDHANDEGRCWPSMGRIAKKTCMSVRGVQKVIRRLEAGGWLAVDVGGGRHGCNNYTIKTPNVVRPERGSPPNVSAKNPEPGSPEPSRTISKKEETNVSSKKKRGTRLPDDWVLPREWGEWAISQGWPEQAVRDQADRFKDYWIAKSGQGATKRDWQATWRNWMRNSKSPRIVNGGRTNAKKSVTERLFGGQSGMDSGEDRNTSQPLLPARHGRDC